MILTVTLNQCIDKTIFVEENRPGEFIKATNLQMITGGKGNNVARVLTNFGYDVLALTLVGGFEGKLAVKMLSDEGIKNVPIWIEERTREIITVFETKSNRQTAYFEPSPHVDDDEKENLMEVYKELAKKSELVVLSGSVPYENLDEIYFEMITHARKLGIKSILDSRDMALKYGMKAAPYLVKPNVREAEFVLDRKISSHKDMLSSLDEFESLGIEVIVMSLGEKGALIRNKGITYMAKPPEVETVNPVGSGDSMVAGIAMGIVDRLDLIETIRLGMAAGAANASIWDAACITKEQVSSHLGKTKVERI